MKQCLSRLLSLSCLTLLLATSCAQDPAPSRGRRPLLWRIEGEPASYLFGTIHVPDRRVAVLPQAVEEALAAADVVTTELKLDAATQMGISAAMLLPEGQRLSNLLPDGPRQRLERWLARRKLPLAQLDHLQIWAVEAQLPLLDRMDQGGAALDTVVYRWALGRNKEVAAIESVEEQLSIFRAFSQADQIESLDKSLTQLEEADRDGRDLLEEILVLYLEGDEAALLDHLMKDIDLENPREARFYELLITERDQRMAERVDRLRKERPGVSFFFAFGAAHMPGLRKHLEERGYRINRVETAPQD